MFVRSLNSFPPCLVPHCGKSIHSSKMLGETKCSLLGNPMLVSGSNALDKMTSKKCPIWDISALFKRRWTAGSSIHLTNGTTPALHPDKPNLVIPQRKFGDRLVDLVDFKRIRISSRNCFTEHIHTTDINVEILSPEFFQKLRCCYAYVYWYLMVMNQTRLIKGVVGLSFSKLTSIFCHAQLYNSLSTQWNIYF